MRQTIERTRRQLSQKLGYTPEPEEMAAELEMTIEEFQEWEGRFQVNQLQSLDEVYTDHSLLFSDFGASAEDQVEQTQLKGLLKGALEKLPEREAMVLQFYFVEELNVYEIAAILDVTTGRVSQIKKAAINRLREMMEEKLKHG